MRFHLGIAGAAVLAVGLTACLGAPLPAWATSGSGIAPRSDVPPAANFRTLAKIVPTARPLQCVPYAREISGIRIRGDAWTWWESARGRYARGQQPQAGAVLTMKKTRRLRLGHLAVVRRVVDSRTIIVDQANWLNRGRIHLNSAVRDVSAKNDWSAVRVWYTPGARYGSRTYAAQGFIYPRAPVPKTPKPKTHVIRQASLDRVPLPRRRPADLGPAQAMPTGVTPIGVTLAEVALASVPLPRPKPVVAGTAGAQTPSAVQAPRRRAEDRRRDGIDSGSNRG